MASKNVIIKRKIANEIFELLPKTSGAQVEVTYGSEVKDLAAVLATVYTDLESWNTFKKDVDFAGTDSALDTLRELIDMLSKEDVATSIAGKLKAIDERLDAIELAAQQLAQTVADNKAAADATEVKAEQNKKDIAALTQTVADNKSAIEGTVATLTQTVADNKTAAEQAVATLTQTVADNKTAAEQAVATLTQTVADNKAAIEQTVADNKTAAEQAVAAVDAKAVKNAEDITALQGVVAQNARVIVAEEVPADLTEADLMMQIIA